MDKIKNRLEDVFNSLDAAIISTDCEGTITWMNQTAEVLSGFNTSDWAGKSLETIFRTKGLATSRQFSKMTEEVDEKGKVTFKDGQAWIIDRNNSKLPMDGSAKPLNDSFGKLAGLFLELYPFPVLNHINSETGGRPDLSDTGESFAKAMVDAIPDMMFRIDRNGVFLDYKADIKDLHEQNKSLIGQRNRDVTPPEFADLIDYEIEKTLASGQIRTFEYQLPVPGKGLLDFEARMVPSGKDEIVAIVRNITVQKKAEKVLVDSEIQFVKLFRSNPVPLGITRAQDVRIVDVNDAWTSLTGYSREEAIGHNTVELGLAKPQTLQSVRDKLQEEGEIRQFEIMLYNRSGQERIVLLNSETIELGNERYFLNSLLDITDRKKAEEKLSESEARFVKAFYTNPAPQSILSKKTGQVLDVNDATCNLFGYSREELIGISPAKLNLWENPQEQIVALEDLKTSGHVLPREVKIRKKSGEIRSIIFAAEQIVWMNEPCLITSSLDITERNRAIEERYKSEQRYRLIADNTMDVIWVLDPIANKFTYVSPSVFKLRGYTPEEVMAQPVSEALTPESNQLISESFAENLAMFFAQGTGTMSFTSQVDQPHKNGSIVHTEVITTFIFNEKGQVEIIGVSRDITNRKLAEEKLLESEQRYSALFKKSNIPAVLMKLPEVRMVDANEAAEKLTGYKREELIGRTSAELGLISNKQRSSIITQFENEKSLTGNEIQITTKSGEERFISINTNPLKINGQPYAITTMVDVTKRIRAEEKVKVALTKYKTLFDTFPLGITVSDKEGNILETNSIAEKLLGLRKDEQLLRQISGTEWQIIRPDGAPMQVEEYASVRALKEGNTVQNVEMGIIKPDKGITWINVTAAPIPLEQYGVVVTYSDITERKQFQDQLKQNEESFKGLFEQNAVPMWVFDPDSLAFLAVNDAAVNYYGYSREEFLAMTIRDIRPVEDLDKLDDIIKQKRETPYRMTGPWRHLKKDGTTFLVEIASHIINWQGQRAVIIVALDRTAQIKAEQSLLASEVRFRELAENIQEVFWIYDHAEKRIVYISPAYEAVWGRTVEDLYKDFRSYLESIYPEDKPLIVKALEKQATGEQTTTEYRIVRNDGTIRWIWDRSVPIIESGRIVRSIGVASDITERRLAEEKVHQAEVRYRALIENAPDGIVTISRDGKFKYVSPSAARIFEYTQADAETGNPDDLTHPEDLPRVQEVLAKVIQNPDYVPTLQYRFLHKRKGWRWIESTFSNLLALPSVEAIVINFREIHERKITELALHDSEEKYRTLTESFESVIITVDSDGIFHYANRAAAASFNILPSELEGKNMYDLFPPQMAENQMNDIRKVITTRKSMINEAESFIQGVSRWYRTSIMPIVDVSGNVGQAMVNVVDITERINAEKELRIAKEKAEESDQLKSAFLANISHEIRTPMNGILGFTELLSIPDLKESERAEYINIIKLSGDRMLNTINDLIEISSIETGSVIVTETEMNINDMLRFMYRFFELQAYSKGLQITGNMPLPDEEATVITDMHKLDRILMNLIRNAVKFTDRGHIEFGYEPRGNKIEFYVTDTGMGIPADKLDAIFERFVQANLNLNRSYEGSGLGLSISKAYIEMLGGSISVESEVNVGTTFRFTIPWKTKEGIKSNDSEARESIHESFLSGKTILVAEDDDINYIYLKAILEPICKNLIRAKDGQEAVGLCRETQNIDFVLMDIKMPGLDGYEAVKLIRQFNRDLVIIAQTAYALEGEVDKAIQAGCDDYIAKPFNKSKLLEVLAKNRK